MAFAPAPEGIVQVTMSFDDNEHGWQEKFYFNGNYTVAMDTLAAQGVSYRMRFLPENCTLLYARMLKLGKPRGGALVEVPYPIDGYWTGLTTVVGDVEQNSHTNNPDNAVAVRFEDGNQNYSDRWFHGVPDAQVKNRRLVDTIYSGVGTVPTIPSVANDTVMGWGQRVGDYLSWLQGRTVMVSRRIVAGEPAYYFAAIAKVISRGFTTHRVGRPFGTSPGRYGPR